MEECPENQGNVVLCKLRIETFLKREWIPLLLNY